MLKIILILTMSLYLGACSLKNAEDPGSLVPKTVDDDPSLNSLEFNGTKLFVETYGDSNNPPIIFLHGGPGGDHMGLTGLKELQDDYYLVFWDQRGSGLSRRHPKEEITLENFEKDLELVVDHFTGAHPAVLVGHSWGGIYAASYARKNPSTISHVAYLDPGPLQKADSDYMTVEDNVIFDKAVQQMLWGSEFFYGTSHEFLDFKYLEVYLSSDDDMTPLNRMGAIVIDNLIIKRSGPTHKFREYNFTDGLSSFSGRSMIVWAMENENYSTEFRQRTEAYFNSPTVVQGSFDHNFPWKESAQTVKLLRDFLDGSI